MLQSATQGVERRGKPVWTKDEQTNEGGALKEITCQIVFFIVNIF
jgi:hypothetical protein